MDLIGEANLNTDFTVGILASADSIGAPFVHSEHSLEEA